MSRRFATPQALWTLVAIVVLLRGILCWTLPLTGDEAYYWEWARRPAFGYVDHPPGVAWAIMSGMWLGHTPFAVRFGCWLGSVVAIFATADAARRLAARIESDGGMRAAALAAASLATAPIATLAGILATPDGPYLAAWALVLDLSIALDSCASPWLACALGLALGATVFARIFGFAAWVAVAWIFRRRPAVLVPIFGVALLVISPFLLWNAQQHWVTLHFALVGRHVNEGLSFVRPLLTGSELLVAYGPGTVLSIVGVLWLSLHRPQRVAAAERTFTVPLLWFALPLTGTFLLLSLVERVEVYWFLAPYATLVIACAVHRHSVRLFPSVLLLGLVGMLALLPFSVLRALDACGVHLHRPGIFEIFTSAALAHDVRRLTLHRPALVMTTGYGFSSLLDYEAGIAPVVIGYDEQGRESWRWFAGGGSVTRALFVDKAPLSERPDLAHRLAMACSAVHSGPILREPLPYLPPRLYATTWCEGMHPHAIGILRWEGEP